MRRVFVYEHFSGSPSLDVDPELMAAGLAMRDAIVHDLLSAGDCAVSVASAPGVPGAAPGARPVRVAAVDSVGREAAAHDLAWVIAPETDGVLARLRQAVGAARWLGCTAEAISVAASKPATLAHAAAHGILTPLAFTALAAASVDGRWVVKPGDGAGALATRLHPTLDAARADVATRAQAGAAATLEAWVDGEPLSLSLVCGGGSAELWSVNRQRLEIDAAGKLSFAGVDVAALPRADTRFAALDAWARTLVATMPGLRGYVGVDLVWHAAAGPVLIEINPRVTMAYVGLSAAVGRNVAAAVLAAHDREHAHAAA